MKFVEIFTDGACSGNPGPGGWATILSCNGKTKTITGGSPDTTNNKMELTAVIEGLKLLKEPCNVTVTSDSKYVCDAINQGWARKWQAAGWIKSDKKPALNSDLWEELLKLIDVHNVQFVWVKGHDTHPQNQLCDWLAVTECEKYK